MEPSDGWILLHRKIIKSRVFQNADLLKVWLWCLVKANHKDKWVPFKTGRGESEVLIKRGQFIFGRKKAAKELKMKLSSTYKRMLKLKSMQNLNMQSNTHYSIVTINNYKDYQDMIEKKEQVKEQASNNQVATKEQPSSTTNNVNNDKNVKESKKKAVNKKYFEKRKVIIDYLNKILGTKYRHNSKNTITIINARFNDDYTIDDFRKVIYYKHLDWKNNPKMSQYLCPDTLFSNKFEKYLQESILNNGIPPDQKEFSEETGVPLTTQEQLMDRDKK